jgi:hypothetical protein
MIWGEIGGSNGKKGSEIDRDERERATRREQTPAYLFLQCDVKYALCIITNDIPVYS